MAATETVELRFLAELGDLRKELAKMPDIGEKEAKKLVSALERQYKRAASAQKKMANDAKAAAERMGKGLEGVKNAAEGLGGAFGGTAGTVEKMIQSSIALGTSLGPVGAAFGGAVVGVGLYTAALTATASAVVSFIRDADELLSKMRQFEEAGVWEPIPQESIAALNTFADGMDGIGVIGERIQTVLGSELATALNEGVLVVVKMGLAVSDLVEKFDLAVPALKMVASLFGIGEGTIAAMTLATKALDAATAGYDERARELLGTIREEKIENSPEHRERVAAATKAQAEAERAYAEEVRKTVAAVQADLAAREKLAAITRDANSDLLTDLDKIRQAHADREAEILDTIGVTKDHDAVNAALHANEARRIRDTMGVWQDQAQAAADGMQPLIDTTAKIRDGLQQIVQDFSDQAIAVGTIALQAAGAWANFASEAHARHIEDIQAEVEAAEAADEQWHDRRERRIDAQLEDEQARIDALLAQGQITDEQHAQMVEQAQARHAAEMDNLDKRYKSRKKKTKDENDALREQAKKAFKAQKNADRVAAITEAAVTMITLTTAMAYLGPGAPVAAAAIVSPMLATQLGRIDAQKMPEFPMGSMGLTVGERIGLDPVRTSPDHVMVGVRPDEKILSPAESTWTPPVVQLVLDRRLMVEASVDRNGRGRLALPPGYVAGRATVYGGG